MLLAIDLGNTNITFGLFDGPSLLHTFRAEARRERSADEYAAFVGQILSLRGVRSADVTEVILASVVPRLTPVLVQALRSLLAREPLVVSHELKSGIVLRLPNPRQLGMDRLVNAVAVRERALRASAGSHSGSVLARGAIVIDLGTATTFDCVSPAGEFLGGVIVPGVQVSLDGLIARTAQLPNVELSAPERVLGQNTVECLQSGIMYGYASLVDGLVAKLRAELPFECDVVATGGLAVVIAPHTQSLRAVEPDLTLHGLRRLNALNQPAPELT
jgi:type III pantothenate kinase